MKNRKNVPLVFIEFSRFLKEKNYKLYSIYLILLKSGYAFPKNPFSFSFFLIEHSEPLFRKNHLNLRLMKNLNVEWSEFLIKVNKPLIKVAFSYNIPSYYRRMLLANENSLFKSFFKKKKTIDEYLDNAKINNSLAFDSLSSFFYYNSPNALFIRRTPHFGLLNSLFNSLMCSPPNHLLANNIVNI